MNVMKYLRIAAVLAAALLLSAQTSPVTVTATMVSIQLGQPIYSAAIWNKAAGTIQVYYYTSSPNHTWDLLGPNMIFPVAGLVVLPDVTPCPTPTACDTAHSVTWLFRPDPTTTGVVDWQVAWSGQGIQTGTFQ